MYRKMIRHNSIQKEQWERALIRQVARPPSIQIYKYPSKPSSSFPCPIYETSVRVKLPCLAPSDIPTRVFLKAHAYHQLKTSKHHKGHGKQHQNPKNSPWKWVIGEMGCINRPQNSNYLNTAEVSSQNTRKCIVGQTLAAGLRGSFLK